ncbi:beta-1,3-glucan-binding protein-like isoform X1 [Artemia franciscana]
MEKTLLLLSCAVSLGLCQNLIWQEEFDTLDTNVWEHLITGWRGGNWEFQYYSDRPENSFVRDGILHIKPTLTADRFSEEFLYNGVLDLNQEGCNINIDNGCIIYSGDEIINPIQSARLRSSISFSFTYGRVDVRAKMPMGDWIWPAIWLLPTDEVYGGWPMSGEIDLIEVRGNTDFKCGDKDIGIQMMGSTLHWGPAWDQNQYWRTAWEKHIESGTWHDDYHIYSFEWTADGFRFYIDNQEWASVYPPEGGFWELGELNGQNIWASGTKMAPFDKPFHFVLNVATGGNFFPDSCVNGAYDKPWYAGEPTSMRSFWEARDLWLPTWNAETEQNEMLIDYIRVYEI